jgi:cyclopropane fatty-acyl-phospholipid synthase-like methyltransferase
MTHLEFHKLPFRMVLHMSLDTEHLAAYKTETPKGNIIIHACTRKRKNGEFGKSSRTYIFRNKEYKSVDELLKDYNGTE